MHGDFRYEVWLQSHLSVGLLVQRTSARILKNSLGKCRHWGWSCRTSDGLHINILWADHVRLRPPGDPGRRRHGMEGNRESQGHRSIFRCSQEFLQDQAPCCSVLGTFLAAARSSPTYMTRAFSLGMMNTVMKARGSGHYIARFVIELSSSTTRASSGLSTFLGSCVTQKNPTVSCMRISPLCALVSHAELCTSCLAHRHHCTKEQVTHVDLREVALVFGYTSTLLSRS